MVAATLILLANSIGANPLARPRAFDEEESLDAAIACFWRRGFQATSVRDLAEEMGISGPSLYNAFGGKRALFIQALERYAELWMRKRIVRLENKASPKSSIHEFLHELVERSTADKDRRGCLIVNSALEVSPHDVELRGVIASYLRETEMFFRRCVERGQQIGEIQTNMDPRETARHFLGCTWYSRRREVSAGTCAFERHGAASAHTPRLPNSLKV